MAVDIKGPVAVDLLWPGLDVKDMYNNHPEALEAALTQQLNGSLEIDNAGNFQVTSQEFDIAPIQAMMVPPAAEDVLDNLPQVNMPPAEEGDHSEDDNAGHPLLDVDAVEGELLSDEIDL